MPYSFVSGTFAKSAVNAATPAIDTTGATMIFVVTSSWVSVADPVLSDSQGGGSNTWTKLTTRASGVVKCILWYCKDPTKVGANHTFTMTGGAYCGMIVRAYSGSKPTTPFDAENGAVTASGTSLATGSVSPSENAEIVVAGWASNAGAPTNLSINGGFTLSGVDFDSDGANYFGTGMAILMQTSAAAANPTWSWAGAADAAVAIASFKAEVTTFATGGSAVPGADPTLAALQTSGIEEPVFNAPGDIP